MDSVRRWSSSLLSSRFSGYLLLFLLAFLAYGIHLAGWGFYKDDWHEIWTGSVLGVEGIVRLFLVDRPFMGVVYAITHTLLGESPFAWQIFAFIVRLVSSLLFWWLARLVFPRNERLTLLMAAVFILYPGFLQQPNANTFQNHFIGYSAALFSIALSIRALQVEKRSTRIILIALSVGLAIFYWLIYEYMIGLEAVRFLLIDFVLQREHRLKLRERAIRLIKHATPFLAGMVLFLVWRVFIFESARSVTNVGLLGAMYKSQPVQMILRLVLETGKDAFETVVLPWFVPVYQLANGMDYTTLALGIVIAAAGVGLYFLLTARTPAFDAEGDLLTLSIAVFGVLLGVVTLLPILLSNRDVHFYNQFDRYTLQATLGVAIAVGAFLASIRSATVRRGLIAFVIGVSLLTHFANAVYYKQFWNVQKQLWWQLSWRAPDLKEQTTLIPILPASYQLAEGYEIWGPANLIYSPGSSQIKISGDIVNLETLGRVLSRESYGRTFRNLEYIVEFENSLVLSMPGSGSCMHVLGGRVKEYSGNDEPVARLIGDVSRPDLILTDAAEEFLPENIFGEEPAHGWCYYYQKVSLERQAGRWENAAAYVDEAMERGLTPADPSEWMPFYESAYRAGDMDRANEIGGHLRSAVEFIGPYCAQFTGDLLEETSRDAGKRFLVTNLCPGLEMP